MKKQLLSIIIVTVFLLPNYGYCDIYRFTGGEVWHTVYFEAYINGEKIRFAPPGDQLFHGITDWGTTAVVEWDIDATAMTATFLSLHSKQVQPVSNTGLIHYKEEGFGGLDLEIPFTLYLQDSSFDTITSYGPFTIDPDLFVDTGGEWHTAQTGVMKYKGAIFLLGQQFAFDLTAPIEEVRPGRYIQFDDSFWPEQLDATGQFYRGYTIGLTNKIVDVYVEGIRFEIYNQQVNIFSPPRTWQGQLIPEPATICLLGLGSLVLLRKRRP